MPITLLKSVQTLKTANLHPLPARERQSLRMRRRTRTPCGFELRVRSTSCLFFKPFRLKKDLCLHIGRGAALEPPNSTETAFDNVRDCQPGSSSAVLTHSKPSVEAFASYRLQKLESSLGSFQWLRICAVWREAAPAGPAQSCSVFCSYLASLSKGPALVQRLALRASLLVGGH